MWIKHLLKQFGQKGREKKQKVYVGLVYLEKPYYNVNREII